MTPTRIHNCWLSISNRIYSFLEARCGGAEVICGHAHWRCTQEADLLNVTFSSVLRAPRKMLYGWYVGLGPLFLLLLHIIYWDAFNHEPPWRSLEMDSLTKMSEGHTMQRHPAKGKVHQRQVTVKGQVYRISHTHMSYGNDEFIHIDRLLLLYVHPNFVLVWNCRLLLR